MSIQLVSLTFALAGNGRILKSDIPLAELPIILGIIKEEGVQEIITTKTDMNGQFDFGEIKGGVTYIVSFTLDGKPHRWTLGEGSSQITIGSGIKGKVVGKDGVPINSREVVLADEFGDVSKTTSDVEGYFVFNELLNGKNYIIKTTVSEVDFSNTLSAPSETVLKVLDVTTEDSKIAVEDHEIVIHPQEGILDVYEFLVFVNSGNAVYNNDEIYVSLPESRKLTTTNLMDCCFKQAPQHALADPMKPLFPGEAFEVSINYKIPIEGSKYALQREVYYPTKFFGFFVLDENTGIGVEGDVTDMEFAGRKYKTITNAGVPGKSSMSLQMTGLKTLEIEPQEVETKDKERFPALAIAGGILILIGSAIAASSTGERVLGEVFQRITKSKKILIIAVLFTLAIHLAAWGYGSLQKGEEAQVYSPEAYEKAKVSEDKNNPCAVPEGYTEETWREHMGHHPEQYEECLEGGPV